MCTIVKKSHSKNVVCVYENIAFVVLIRTRNTTIHINLTQEQSQT
jgi:hypothetical protein